MMNPNDWLTLLEHGGLAAVMALLFWLYKQKFDTLQDRVDNEYRAEIQELKTALQKCMDKLDSGGSTPKDTSSPR
jgi:hypothetical protein